MKKLILPITAAWLLNSSCATIFANSTACHTKPAKGQPKRKIRPVPFVFDILMGYGVGLAVDFATGAIYKPCSGGPIAMNESFEWSETVDVPGVPKDKLYQRAAEWYNTTFVDMREVIQDKDKESGTFYGKGTMKVSSGRYHSDYVDFSINISVKDGKYKYVINNFRHHGTWKQISVSGGNLKNRDGEYPVRKKYWDKIKKGAQSQANGFISSLKGKMKSASLAETF